MDFGIPASTFALVFVAELPGKTTFATLLLAARGKAWPVFLGAAAAFTIHSAIAVAAGSLLALLPRRPVEIAAGAVFALLSILLWREKMDVGRPTEDQRSHFTKAFGLIFMTQWGDPSQLATAACAARFGSPIPVFLAATGALWAVSGLAAFIGHHSGKTIHPAILQKIAAGVLAAVGLALVSGIL